MMSPSEREEFEIFDDFDDLKRKIRRYTNNSISLIYSLTTATHEYNTKIPLSSTIIWDGKIS